jgi:hypothetical protein
MVDSPLPLLGATYFHIIYHFTYNWGGITRGSQAVPRKINFNLWPALDHFVVFIETYQGSQWHAVHCLAISTYYLIV